MFRFEFLEDSLEDWLTDHLFPPELPIRLIWEPGFDWQQAMAELEDHPLSWDPEAEARHKYLQETAQRITEEEGIRAAHDWLKSQR